MVVRKIVVVLRVQGRKETRKQARAVVAFPQVFRRVVQPAVADQKIVAAARQINRMHAGCAAGGEGGGDDVVLSIPDRALDRNARFRDPVNGGEGEILCLTVVPAEPQESTNVAGDLLIGIHSETVFESARLVDSVDVRSGSGFSA